jgi:hypothetical protein
MQLHLSRTEVRRFGLFRCYRLEARLDDTPEKIAALQRHRIVLCELFGDPAREAHYRRAQAEHEAAAKVSHWVDSPEAMLKSVWQEWAHSSRAMALYARTMLAFRITVGDLVAGVVIEHKHLALILEVEHHLIASIDALQAFLAAGLDYQHGREDAYVPGRDDPGTPPAHWLSDRRRW